MKTITTILLFSIISMPMNSQNQTCNCCTEKHSEFDFWMGSWTVTNPDGTPAGSNIIDKIQDNCILRENWTSATPGYTGTSTNFFNATANQWEQVWVDNQGGSLHLKGHKVGKQMILKTDEQENSDGQPFFHRVTWTHNEDGTVRQYWETITNNKDIVVAFDGLYKKTE